MSLPLVVLLAVACCSLLCVAHGVRVKLASGATVYVPEQTYNVTAASVFYSSAATDNAVTATDASESWVKAHGYEQFGDEAFFISADTPTSALPAGAVPLKTFYSAKLKDTLTTAAPQGMVWAQAKEYDFVRVEGYCLPGTPPTDSFASVFVTYWSESREDSFIVLVGSSHETDAKGAGYKLMWTECYVVPSYKTWPDAGPQKQVPVPKSADLLDWEYLPTANANYGHADTWYPSWASNGNLYSPWTDGSVNGVGSYSGGDSRHGYTSTTGFATIIGDDPFTLNVTKVGVFTSSSFPYQSRYPCGTLVYNGVWFYSTYYLNNPNSTTPQGDPVGPNPSPNCGNWCVQGPVSGFRHSTDYSDTWQEPRLNATGPYDNVFNETSIHNTKVKYGAPHFVDFGKNMEHSPDGKAYIVGHGASRPEAIQAWMLGDEIYLARADPTPEALNDKAQWEFYAGGHGSEAKWVQGDVAQAKPLFVWNDHTGVVTMTYHPAIQKYILVIGTASFYPSMVKQFDTYFLESDDITGPWKYITYLSEFGPEAYFVHFPSKFLATSVNTTAGTYDTFLSYSANFAFKQSSNPPGSGYHWSLQQSRFRLSSEFSSRLAAAETYHTSQRKGKSQSKL